MFFTVTDRLGTVNGIDKEQGSIRRVGRPETLMLFSYKIFFFTNKNFHGTIVEDNITAEIFGQTDILTSEISL